MSIDQRNWLFQLNSRLEKLVKNRITWRNYHYDDSGNFEELWSLR